MPPAIAPDDYTTDLAGELTLSPAPLRILQRIRQLTPCYVNEAILHDRLADLPAQWVQPQVRPWRAIDWRDIHVNQIRDMDPTTFSAILLGAINTEAPIRGYTQSSRQYLQTHYPAMARFVGGEVDAAGNVTVVGLWEREEKRHTPALAKLYTCLNGKPPTITPHAARPYQPAADAHANLYRHGLHRVATEYGATCLYLWLMAHTTGPLQELLAELVIDEVNHMTKFWGFGLWVYPDSSPWKIGQTLHQAMVQKWRDRSTQGSLLHTLKRMTGELAWDQWSLLHRLTFLYTLDQVMQVLWRWHHSLTPAYLNSVLGDRDRSVA